MTDSATTIQEQLTHWLLRRAPSAGIRRVTPLEAALASDTGHIRKENQDRAGIARTRDKAGRTVAIAGIADGIGGMRDGASCASRALAALFASVYTRAQSGGNPEAWLEAAFAEANEAVHTRYKLEGGTTLVALLLIEGEGGWWASVGDSRLYVAHDAALVQMSKDDTIAGQLGKRPDIGTEQSKLLQFIGIGDPLEICVEPVKAAPGETALLTTDGVHFLERPAGVLGLVRQHAPDPGTCVRRLVEMAKWAGGPDNATAVVIPFHVDFDAEPAPTTPCLEVWDPYGEIRILGAPAQAYAEALTESHNLKSDARNSPTEPSSPASANVTDGDVTIANDKGDVELLRKPKRKRKSRKKHDALGGKAPQVQLEFSGKGD